MATLDWFWHQMQQSGYDGPLHPNGQGVHSPWTPLTFAARCVPSYVSVLLKQGADIHQREQQKQQSAFLCASAGGSIEAVQTLLNHGANLQDTDQYGSNALALAILEDKEEMIRFLIEQQCPINQESALDQQTPIVFHLATHYPKLLSLACEYGANFQVKAPESKNILMYFLQHCPVLGVHATTFEEVFAFFEQQGINFDALDDLGNSALHYACARFYWAIPLLLRKGLDPNAPNHDGQTPIMNFVQHQHFLNLDYFNDYSPDWNATRKDGCSVLFLACEKTLKLTHWQFNNSFEKSELFHIKHREPYQSPYPYLMGSFEDVLDISFADILINNGAHPHQSNAHGANVLMMAARVQPETIETLLQAGVSPHQHDHQGFSVLDCVLRSHATRDQFQLLIDAGAPVDHVKTEEHQANPDLWAYWKSLKEKGDLIQHFPYPLSNDTIVRRI